MRAGQFFYALLQGSHKNADLDKVITVYETAVRLTLDGHQCLALNLNFEDYLHGLCLFPKVHTIVLANSYALPPNHSPNPHCKHCSTIVPQPYRPPLHINNPAFTS